jgi:hypothetical protein
MTTPTLERIETDIAQLRSLEARRFPTARAGRLSIAALEQVETAVRYCLGL